jgi:hypothetical protein
LFVSWQQKNKLLQKSFEASEGVAQNKTSSATASLATGATAPAAAPDAVQVEGSAADSLLNGTAKTGTVVRVHGLTNEYRRLNFDKVGVLVKTVSYVNVSDSFTNHAFSREWCAALTQLGDAIKSMC